MEYVIEEVASRNGLATLKLNGLFLHSKYDPKIEAQRIAEKKYKAHHTHIIFGYGLGYIVDELLEIIKEEHILIIDPLIEKKQIQLQKKHEKHKKIVYWEPCQPNTLAYTIADIADGLELKINVICGINYEHLFQKEYHEILRYLRDFQNKTQINKNTVVFFAKQWQKNLTKNLLNIVNDESLSVLQNRFDLPVVIASGGPSLTKQLSLPKEIEKHVIIIAAGSTINSLLAAGIEPDFVVSIDGGEPNYNHFKDLKCKNTRLIYSTFNHYGIRDVFTKRAYVFAALKQGSIVNYLNKNIAKNLPMVVGGGTVAHFAYSIAHLFNSGPVTMIGQDLAYTNNQTHANNNKHTQKVEKLEELNIDLITTEGYYGEEVLTSKSFHSMKMTFEEIVRFHKPEVPTFNSTEGGIKIKGLEQLSFKEFAERYVDFKKIKNLSILDETIDQKNSQVIIKQVFETELDRISKLKRFLQEALDTLKRNSSTNHFDKNTLKKLDKIDKKIAKLSKEVLIHFLIEPITIEVETCFLEQQNETKKDAFKRIYNQSRVLYERLMKALDTSNENIVEILQQLKDEREKNNE